MNDDPAEEDDDDDFEVDLEAVDVVSIAMAVVSLGFNALDSTSISAVSTQGNALRITEGGGERGGDKESAKDAVAYNATPALTSCSSNSSSSPSTC